MMNKEEVFGGSLTDIPNEKYKKFFEKFSEIETITTDQWRPVHLLGYFCKKYYETYNIAYKFKFNSPSPSKCFEVFQIKRLSNLLTSQPQLLKNYIDWVFENKVVKSKRRLTSISFITNEYLMFEYRDNVLMIKQNTNTIDRSTILPENYKSVFAKTDFKINTFGELAFLSQMLDPSKEILTAFNELESLGLDKNILSKII